MMFNVDKLYLTTNYMWRKPHQAKEAATIHKHGWKTLRLSLSCALRIPKYIGKHGAFKQYCEIFLSVALVPVLLLFADVSLLNVYPCSIFLLYCRFTCSCFSAFYLFISLATRVTSFLHPLLLILSKQLYTLAIFDV